MLFSIYIYISHVYHVTKKSPLAEVYTPEQQERLGLKAKEIEAIFIGEKHEQKTMIWVWVNTY